MKKTFGYLLLGTYASDALLLVLLFSSSLLSRNNVRINDTGYNPSFNLSDIEFKTIISISSVVSPLQSSTDTMFSVAVENTDCFDSGVVCRKSLHINVGRSFIVFDDDTGEPVSLIIHIRCCIMVLMNIIFGQNGKKTNNDHKFVYLQNLSSMVDRRHKVSIWPAGLFTVVHFPAEDITILWDKKTTVHIQVGPVWQVSASAKAQLQRNSLDSNKFTDSSNCDDDDDGFRDD